MAISKVVKLTFQRQYGTFTGLGLGYRLNMIENGGPAVKRPTNRDLYRVGDVVNEEVVKEFAEAKRDYHVRIKS